jgi:hypothetical protein
MHVSGRKSKQDHYKNEVDGYKENLTNYFDRRADERPHK